MLDNMCLQDHTVPVGLTNRFSMLRIALINLIPKINSTNYLGFNHGLAYLSAIVKLHGHHTRLFTFSHPCAEEQKDLVDYQPHVLFIYLTTNQYLLFDHMMRDRWRGLNIPVFVGGPHAISCPREVMSVEGVTGVCIGEGDVSVNHIADRIERGGSFQGIPNIWYRCEKQIVKNSVGVCAEDLDNLPFPDREIFPYRYMLKEKATNLMGFEFLTSRGCVYTCRYCINPLLTTINHPSKAIRRRSIDNVIQEILSVTEHYSYRGMIGFHDDNFTLDISWLETFADIYRRKIGLPFWCNSHIHNLHEKTIYYLRKAGCKRVHVGIECGNEQMRRQLLGKRLSNNEILEKVQMLKKHHMKIVTTFMMGLPDENEDTVNESITLCRAISPDWVLLSTFCPYPGTKLYSDLVSTQQIHPEFYKKMDSDSFYTSTYTYPQQGFPQDKLTYYFNNFTRLAGISGASPKTSEVGVTKS